MFLAKLPKIFKSVDKQIKRCYNSIKQVGSMWIFAPAYSKLQEEFMDNNTNNKDNKRIRNIIAAIALVVVIIIFH